MKEKPWRDNLDGKPPRGAENKRVVVELANGTIAGRDPVTTVSPIGWAVKSTRWTLTGSPFDVKRYQLQ